MAGLTTAHSPEHDELAALYALRALEGEELADFERHYAGCAQCHAIVRRDQLTLAALTSAAPEMDPSPGFKERLLARAAAQLEVQEAPPAPIPFRPRRRQPWLMALAAAIALVLGGGAFQLYLNQVVETVPLQGTAAGAAMVVVHRSGATELQLSGLATPPAGQVYEAWVIRPGDQPQPAGTARSGQATLPLPASGSIRGSTVALTLEPDPGSPLPTTPPFLAAPVPA